MIHVDRHLLVNLLHTYGLVIDVLGYCLMLYLFVMLTNTNLTYCPASQLGRIPNSGQKMF
jgi:hypothetical protein